LVERANLLAIDLPGFGASERSDGLLSPKAIGEVPDGTHCGSRPRSVFIVAPNVVRHWRDARRAGRDPGHPTGSIACLRVDNELVHQANEHLPIVVKMATLHFKEATSSSPEKFIAASPRTSLGAATPAGGVGIIAFIAAFAFNTSQLGYHTTTKELR
jgi:hypothetical protein